MSKLSNIKMKNYKNIDNTEAFEFKDLTVLIGPNGSGKSNFISVLYFLKKIAFFGASELNELV